ncbi:MAG: hypothetical protein KAU94_08585 [Verrucomicrobia bacterium]|nr:hypothetical protein [Verrucomicrobiota bacterium]
MKKQLIGLLAVAMVFPVLAQETNEFRQRRGDGNESVEKKRERPKRPEWTEQQRKERMERKYQFMDKALSSIGVSAEDRIKIHELQEGHRQKMKENMARGIEAREKLSGLQDKGATEEEIDAAIQEVSDAMTEQLKILVRNRMEMEKILGKEKYARLMENARKQFHKHGRSGGPGMPPRPGLPPIPGEGKNPNLPPLPNAPPPPPPK